MTDPAPAPVAPVVPAPAAPIEVNPNVTATSLAMGVRQVAMIGGGAIAALGFINKHDWSGLVQYLESDATVPICAAIVALGTLAYGQWRFFRANKKVVTWARTVDNSIAVVKGEQ